MRWTGSAARRLRGGLRRFPTRRRTEPSAPIVSVVVTVSDEQRDLLEACLRSLDDTAYDHLDTHVVAYGREAEHATLGEARNAGLDRVRGAYLMFLEASETLTEPGLAALVGRLEASGSDLAVGGRDQEGDGDGVRHPDLTGVRLADRPDTVADTAWGNKVFRRSSWTQRFPAADVEGLEAMVVRAYVEAGSFDLLPQVVSEAADPAAGLPFGQVLTVIDHVHAWAASVEEVDHLLRPAEHAAVRRAWLAALLAGDGTRFLDDVEHAAAEQWDLLRRTLSSLAATADEDVLRALPWETRVKLWLLDHGRREDLEDFLQRRRWEEPSHPTEARDGRVYATVWPYGDRVLDVPDDRFELTEGESPLVASLQMVRWLDPRTLELDLFAYIALVEDGPMQPELTASLVDDRGRRVHLDVEHRPGLEATRFAGERFHRHDQGGFRLRVDASRVLDAPRWTLELTLASNGVTRSGTVNHRDHNGVLGERLHRLVDGRVWGPRAVGLDGMEIEVLQPAFVLREAAVAGRTVRGRIAPIGPVEARSVVLTRVGEEVVAGLDPEGRFAATLPDPCAGETRHGTAARLEEPEWQLRVVAVDDSRHGAAYAEDPPSGDDAGLLAWRRSHAGRAAVHEVAHRPVVSDVTLTAAPEGDEALVRLRWLGAVPEDWTVSLVSQRVTLPATEVSTDGGVSTARIPLSCDEWGLGTTAAPCLTYRLALTSGAGQDAETTEAVGTDEELVTRTPVEHLGHQVRLRVRQTPQRRLAFVVNPPQADDEIGPTAQRRLHEEYWAASYELDPHAVYLQSYTGHVATDSPRAIHEYLHRHHPHLTLYWGVADRSVHLPEGAVPVVMRTRAWFDVLGRAAYIVDNIDFDRWFVKRPGQRYLQTFHGYPAKSMGLLQWRAKRFPERKIQGELDRTMRKWDMILTPSPEMDVHYRREYGYDGPILNRGYPRDDLLVSGDTDEIRRTTRERLGVGPDQKAILYAPTFRDHLATDHRSVRLAAHLDLESASEALGEDYVLLMRGHRFHSIGNPRVGRGRQLVDVTDYPEINDLILAADAAVLDYSSLRFDFALTRKPMVFLVPDLDVYSGPVRGFLYDYASTAPGPLLTDAGDVVKALSDLDGLAERHRDAVEEMLRTYQRHQDGRATERVVKAFFGDVATAPNRGGQR